MRTRQVRRIDAAKDIAEALSKSPNVMCPPLPYCPASCTSSWWHLTSMCWLLAVVLEHCSYRELPSVSLIQSLLDLLHTEEVESHFTNR